MHRYSSPQSETRQLAVHLFAEAEPVVADTPPSTILYHKTSNLEFLGSLAANVVKKAHSELPILVNWCRVELADCPKVVLKRKTGTR